VQADDQAVQGGIAAADRDDRVGLGEFAAAQAAAGGGLAPGQRQVGCGVVSVVDPAVAFGHSEQGSHGAYDALAGVASVSAGGTG
jgi:hypothetical protein